MAKDEKKPHKGLTKKRINSVKNTNNHPSKMRLNPEDNIAKSKKLVEKIQKRNSSVKSPRSFVRSNNDLRVRSNGKPMPPLSELERMYEDSDDDDPSKTVTSQTNKMTTNSSENLTSPKTIKKIADKMMNMISNLQDSTTVIVNDSGPPPPKKRKKSLSKDRLQGSDKFSINCYGNIIDKIDLEYDDELPIKTAKKSSAVNVEKSHFDTTSDNISAWLQNCSSAVNSDGSNDSNKTVAYDYDHTKTPPSSNISRPQPFSPLPSTSKDRETINKNEQLFNESLISETSMFNNNLTKLNILNDTNTDSEIEVKTNDVKEEKESLEIDTSNNDDLEIIQTPCETIVIDDEIATCRPIERKYSNKSDIVECIDIVKPTKTENSKVTECSEPIVIDDDDDGYKFINDSPTQDEVTEVIDIDNIIAENKAIIEKYSKKNDKDINTITYVDTTTISNLTTNNKELCNSSDTQSANKNIKDSSVPKSSESANMQENKTNEIQDIVKNYFSNNSHNRPQEQVSGSTVGTSLWNKVTDWLNNLTPYYATNKKRISRGRSNIIVIDDSPTPTPNIPRPNNHHMHTPNNSSNIIHLNTPSCTTSSREINGVQYKNSLSNSKVNLDYEGNSEYMNVYYSNGDMYITSSDRPPPGIDNSNLVHKKYPVQELFQKQALQPCSAASQSPAKGKSPTSKNLGDCPICMDSLANNSVASTICGHVFCLKCIEAAFKASGKRCPTCRKTLKKGGYHQIFL